jgi:hypothetical protein
MRRAVYCDCFRAVWRRAEGCTEHGVFCLCICRVLFALGFLCCWYCNDCSLISCQLFFMNHANSTLSRYFTFDALLSSHYTSCIASSSTNSTVSLAILHYILHHQSSTGSCLMATISSTPSFTNIPPTATSVSSCVSAARALVHSAGLLSSSTYCLTTALPFLQSR